LIAEYKDLLNFCPEVNVLLSILRNMECPFIKLLSTWDDYLTNVLGKRTGYDVQREIKKI